MKRGGFWIRVWAYMIDIFPIVVVLATVSYALFGFDDTLKDFWAQPADLDARIEFYQQRNQIRDLSFLVWILYCWIAEASKWQGTLGKRVLGLQVVDKHGHRLTTARSLARNLSKVLSLLSLGIGFFWVAFSSKKVAWHDLIARTAVVRD